MTCEPTYNPYDGCRTRARVWGVLVLALSASALGFAATLRVGEPGFGTDSVLTAQHCVWRSEHGTPCPTCGYTTAIVLATHGRIGASAATQPAGMLLAMVTAMAVWIAGWVAWTGSTVPGAVLARWMRARTFGVIIAIMLAAWIYKLAIG
ncbi:MAG: DUF2752 domain-containing protein [Phycisphaera sp.]|nr:DUF2752 domain-containing protein [Phycisphaera sp.]